MPGDKAIQQTAVPLAAVAVAVAGLLIENFFHAAGDDIKAIGPKLQSLVADAPDIRTYLAS